jgi:molybdopterin synthase sulfur carrier subunit
MPGTVCATLTLYQDVAGYDLPKPQSSENLKEPAPTARTGKRASIKMSITVKYFASLREKLGRDGDEVGAEGIGSVADVWDRVAPGMQLPPNTLAAVNLDYAELNHTVCDGDEVAFFPPVTGG